MISDANILIVEDEGVTALEIQNNVESWGYNVVGIVSSGEEAIKTALETKPDLIIMDIVLKEEINGIDAAKIIKKSQDLPVIYLTAYGDEKTLQKAKFTVPHAYILKPFEENELKFAVEMALYKHEMEQKLKSSEEKYRTLAENARDIIFIINMDDRIEYLNNYAAQLFGLKPEDLIGKSRENLFPKDIYEKQGSEIDLIIQNGKPTRSEYKISFPKCEMWLDTRLIPLKAKNGEIYAVMGISRDITSHITFEELLKDSEQSLKAILYGSPIPTFLIGKNHKVLYWNKALEKLSGMGEQELIGTDQHWKVFYQEKRPCMVDILVENDVYALNKWYGANYSKSELAEDAYQSTDFFPQIGNEGRWIQFTAATIKDSKGNIVGAIETLEDITELKDKEDKIQSSLNEKEVLLAEIHHRVKNNMQIISSLISLQSDYAADEHTIKMFKDSKDRIRSMALIHEKLYQSNDLSLIDFSDYIEVLAGRLLELYGVRNRIDLIVEADDMHLNIDTAIPCGLIINELVSNSIQHAFPKDKQGKITINFKMNQDEYVLMVSDDGIGFPENIDFKNSESLGLQIVNTLTMQLGGYIELKRNNGTKFILSFSDDEN
jgi:two-component system, sensor histidine kinase PdtaS